MFEDRKRLFIIGGIVAFLIIAIIVFMIFNRKPAPVAVDNTPVSLTWWNPYFATETYDEAIKAFKGLEGNQNVTIKIENQAYGDSYYQSLIEGFATDSGPDIFGLRNDDLPAYKKFMTPITNVYGIKDTELLATYKKEFVPLVVKNTMDLDKIYSVTSFVDNLELYYNENILSQSNIAIPASTWSELDRQVGVLNKRQGGSQDFSQSAIAMGTGFRVKNGSLENESTDYNIARFQDILPMLIFQNGGQLFDYQTNKSIFGNDKDEQDLSANQITQGSLEDATFDPENPTYRAVNFYLNFGDLSTQRYSWNTTPTSNEDAFLQGKLAYIIHYGYFRDIIAQRNDRLQYKVSALPQIDLNNKKTFGYFFMDGISRKLERDAINFPQDPVSQKRLQKSREFLYFLSTNWAQEQFRQKTNLPGARYDIINEQLSGDEKIKIFAAGSLYADNYYKPNITKTERIWGDMIFRIQFENQPLSQSLAQAIREYNILVEKGPRIR